MIYLNNNTILQDVYIPRQDMLQYTTGSSGTYAEGYADGYESGETHQKNLLVTTAFTQNGEYTREDGWSGVTVDVSITSKLEEKTVVISADTTNITPSSGYDGMSAVTVDATEYGQTNYDNGFDDGFDDGYASGSTEEREKLSAVTFTANTAVTMDEGGYSAVTVNVAQTGHTDQELEDAYTSGETHQKSLLGTTAFTINGSYSAENGYSAITVNVPTGQTYNIEQNKPFTATSNGNYTILPSNGTVFVDDRFDSDVDRYYISVRTSGYPSTGYFELLTIEDEFDSSKGYIEIYLSNGSLEYDDEYWSGGNVYDFGIGNIELEIQEANRHFDWIAGKDYDNVGYDVMSAVSLNVNVDTASTYNSGYTSGHTDGVEEEKAKLSAATFTANTAVTLNDGGYSAITVNVPQTGTSATLGDGSFSANGTYSASTDNLDGYSAITINVPTSGGSVKYLEYIETNGTQIGWDTGYNIGTDIDAKIYLDFMPISGNGYGDYWFAYYGDCAENVLFRRAGNSSSIGFMFGNNRTKIDGSGYYVVNGNRYLISLDKNGITDENTGTLLVAVSSSSINSTKNLYLNCEGLSGNNQVYRCIRARYYSFRVENGNGETTLDMRPCLDGNNVPCFYDEVSKTYIYHIGSGTPIAGPISDPSYQSGYTDGIAYQKSLLGTTAFTSNGSFSAENGYSAITVNVPQQAGVYGSKTINANGTYSASTDSLDGFSSVTVNVPQSGVQIPIFFADYIHTDTLSANTYQDYIDTGLFPTDDVVFRVKGYRKGKTQGNRIVGWTPDETTHSDNDDFRLFWTDNSKTPYFDWGSGRINYVNYFDSSSGYTDITCGNYYIYDNVEEQMIVSGSQKSVSELYSAGTIRADVGSWWLKSLEIYDGNTLLFDGVAAYDGSGNVGLYDKVSHTLKTAVTTKQMVYEFDSGSTLPLSSITFTANTSVTVSDKAYTAITVNVPQSSAILGTKTIRLNGTFNASFDNLDGYSAVTVNVPYNTLGDKTFTGNGLYVAGLYGGVSGWSAVTVSVDTASTYASGYSNGYDSGFTAGEDNVENNAQTLSVSANGTYNTGLRTEGYLWNEVIVNVPQTPISATLGTASFTGNGFYSASTDNLDGYSAITVSVPQTYNMTPDDVAQHNFGFVNPIINVDVMIYAYQFSNITGNVTIGDSSTTIGAYAFGNCYGLTSAVITGNVTTIGNNAFGCCMNMTSVTISDNVTTIGNYGFDNTGLKSIVIPSGVTSLGSYAFGQCPLTALTLGQSLTSIPMACFLLTQLKSVTIPDNIQSIGAEAFQQCYKLTGVTFGTGVTYIDRQVFESCSGLTNVRFYSTTEPQLGIAPFNNIKSSGNGYYPNGSDYSNVIAAFPSGWTWHTF